MLYSVQELSYLFSSETFKTSSQRFEKETFTNHLSWVAIERKVSKNHLFLFNNYNNLRL